MIRPFVQRPVQARMRGASMVETLVALVVLSVGLLGIAALFVTSMRSARSSVSRLHAINLVTDMSERIRANPTARAAYTGAPANFGCVGGALGAVNCAPPQMAATDLFIWNQQLNALLPNAGAVANVVFVAGPPDLYTISVTWNEPGEPLPLSYTASFGL
jgi:type IV pilus assembly protein PilV